MILTLTKNQWWFCPWPFCMWGINVTNTRIFCILGHTSCGGVTPVSPLSTCQPKTWPRDGPTSPSPPILPSYWLVQRPTTQSRFWPPEGEGGDWYYITTCMMAEGSKDPCISHIDASHGEWPRTESSLLFCIFFYIVKIIEKSLFYEPEIGFIWKITY